MRRHIFSHEDSNRAGYGWCWDFYLNQTADQRFTLSCRFSSLWKPSRSEGGHQRVPAIRGLRDGVDIYDAVHSMASIIEIDLSDQDIAEMALAIAATHKGIASDFAIGKRLSEERDDARAARDEADRQHRLAPLHESIEAFVLRFDDNAIRPYGYPSHRRQVRQFIGNYFMEHGSLPTGLHKTTGSFSGMGFSGSLVDFTELEARRATD